jgi:hypothetical protein
MSIDKDSGFSPNYSSSRYQSQPFDKTDIYQDTIFSEGFYVKGIQSIHQSGLDLTANDPKLANKLTLVENLSGIWTLEM